MDKAQKKHQLFSSGYPIFLSGMSTNALPSNGHPIVAYSLLRDVFTGLLPSNMLQYYDIYVLAPLLEFGERAS
jgi:hypothetical protein